MNITVYARVAAIGLATGAILLTAIHLREPAGLPPDPATLALAESRTDPLRAELRRCQAIGAEAASDRACLRAWAENRRRFLAPGARPTERIDAAEDGVPSEALSQGKASDDTPPSDNPIAKNHEPAKEASD